MNLREENKIFVTFYLIKINEIPVYIGYTNRNIHKRFLEHIRSKKLDVSQSTVEKIYEMTFDFSWDFKDIYINVQTIQEKESELIKFYGTESSKFQKGIKNHKGGQVWSDVIFFVKKNHIDKIDNNDYDLYAKLRKNYITQQYLSNFIVSISSPTNLYVKAFIKNIYPPQELYIKDFIRTMRDECDHYLTMFTSNMHEDVYNYIKMFSYIETNINIYIEKFVSDMKESKIEYYLKDFAHDL